MYYTSAGLEDHKGGYRGYLTYKDGSKWRKRTKVLAAEGKAEAKRELAAWRAEMEEQAERDAKRGPAAVAAGKKAVPDYVDEYIAGLTHLQPSSVKSYRTSAKFIREAFEAVAVEDLKPEQVRGWEGELVERGLSPSTVGKAHRLLKQAMKDAVNLRVIDWNPVDPVKPPKRVNVKKGKNSLDTDARIAVLDKLDHLEHTPLTIAAYISLYMGLREGEICALKWSDADLELGKLHVGRTIGEGPGGTGCYLREDGTKNGKSRELFMPETLTAIIHDWRGEQAERFREMGARLTPNSFIIGDPAGLWNEEGFKNPRTLGREWTALARAMGIRGHEDRIPTFHDLRHTWATLYMAAGGDANTAASNLGHSNVAMTLNEYASADPDAKREAARLTEVAMTRRPAEVMRFRNGTEG